MASSPLRRRRLLLAALALFLLAASLVLLWFVVLSGLTASAPLRQTYFLRADTSGISRRPVSQWTFFAVCGDGNADCGPRRPALPLGDAWGEGGGNGGGGGGGQGGVPGELVGKYGGGTTSRYYWYMWRFGWVFYLIALFFEVAALGTGLLACLGRVGAVLSGVVALAAWVFLTVAVSLMTATFVKMRDAFRADGRDASVGPYAFGFSWGSWAALTLSTILFWMASSHGRRDDMGVTSAGTHRRRRGWFPWRGTTVNGGSYDGRRVKDEYP